jgi:hypothetical protein
MRGLFDDWGYSAVQANDGGYVLFGVTTNFGPGTYDIFAQKITATGFTQWAKAYGGFAFEYGFTFIKTSTGYAIAGHTSTFGAGDMDMYLLNLDTNGVVVWSKTYGGNDTDVPYSAAQTSDGGFILAGYTTSFGAGNDDYYLVRTNNSGNLLWSKTYGGTNIDEAYSVQQTNDGGYIVNGHTYSFGAGLSDIYLIKTDSNGNSGCNQDSAATLVGNPSTQTVNFTPPMGAVLSVFSPAFTTSGGSTLNTLCIVTGGEEQGVAKENQISIYPNPAKDKFEIRNPKSEIKEVEIYNAFGESVFSQQQTTNNKQQTVIVDISSFSPGIYFIKIKGNSENVIKLIKE